MRYLKFVISFFLVFSFIGLFAQKTKQVDSLNIIINNTNSTNIELANAYLTLSDILPDDTMFYFCNKQKK